MKKILASILALLTVASTLVSCASTSDDTADTTPSATETTTTVETVDPLTAAINDLPDIDGGGEDFTIITRSTDNVAWYTYDVYVEEENGEPINDAVYQRNNILFDELNIVVKDNPSDGPAYRASQQILAGETSFDVITDGLQMLATSLAIPGHAVDYKSLSGIVLENEWWDQNMNVDMTIMDKLYFVTGDISVMDNEGTWEITFNKKMVDDFSLNDYYKMRDDGTWTIDVMLEDCHKVSADLDGDGVMSIKADRYGLSSESFNAYALWAGAGEKVATKNEDDIPEYTLYNERSASVFDKALDLNADPRIMVDHTKQDGGETFATDRVLFQIVGMITLPRMRQYDVEFGILPLPKYEETQDRYYSVGSHGNLTAYSIPITDPDPDRTATILEAMAAISKYTLSPAYYDVSLEGKYIRDDESTDSISIILENRAYDIGIIFDWGSPLQMFRTMSEKNMRDFASQCAMVEPVLKAKIDEFVETLSR